VTSEWRCNFVCVEKDIFPTETNMAIYVHTPSCGGPEIGKVGRSFFSPLVIHLTDARADRKSAYDFHSSTQAYPASSRLCWAGSHGILRGLMALPLLILLKLPQLDKESVCERHQSSC